VHAVRGVPFRYMKPFAADALTADGSSVSELDAPLRSRSGATTMISPSGCNARNSASMPGEK